MHNSNLDMGGEMRSELGRQENEICDNDFNNCNREPIGSGYKSLDG